MRPKDGHDRVPETVVHRALASPARSALLTLLRDHPTPMSVQEIADALTLHANTVRNHLVILENARLVISTRAPARGPGRPRHLYAARDDATATPVGPVVSGVSGDGYRLLAEVLVDRAHDDHPATAKDVEAAAVAWGAARVSRPGTPTSPQETVTRLQAELERLGFASSPVGDPTDGAELVADGCPFGDLARRHPEVACAAHRGVTRGVLAALGGGLALDHLDADPATQRCRTRLRSAA